MSKPQGIDRRKHPRCAEEMSLQYRIPEETVVKDSRTKNISAGGVCFKAKTHMPPPTGIEIQLNKPVSGYTEAVIPIHANAKIVWITSGKTGEYELGIEFVDINENHRKEIIRNVKEICECE